MPTFPQNKFRPERLSSASGRFAAQYRALIHKRPFLSFGLPFIAVIVAGSFVLTPATAIRYEKHDRKVRRMSREEELGMRKGARRVDMKDEYYRLAGRDLDNWEQKRVERLPGESDGVL